MKDDAAVNQVLAYWRLPRARGWRDESATDEGRSESIDFTFW